MDRGKETSIRLLLDVDGKRRKLARFITRETDASLYIVPFSLHGKYHGMVAHMGNGIGPFETHVDYSGAEGSIGDGAPHISIHQSGLVRAYVTKGSFFGALQTPSPTLLVNQHIASLSMDGFDSLPELVGDLREDDRVIPVSSDVKGLRFPIYVNSQHSGFVSPCAVHIKMSHPTLSKPLYYCVSYRRDAINLEGTVEEIQAKKGITAIAGWDVHSMDAGEETDFILIRGE